MHKTETNRRGDVITTYTKLFPRYARPVLSHELAFNHETAVVDTVREMLYNTFIPENARIRVMIGKGGFGLEGIPTFEFQVDEAISTTFVDKADLLSELEDSIQTVMMRYDGNASHLIVNDITLTVLTPNPNNGAASGSQRRTGANTQYLIPGEYQTCENCFYVAWGHLMDSNRFANEYAEWLEGTRQYYPDFKNYGTKKKSDMRLAARREEFPWKNAYVDDAQAEFIVSHTNAAPILRIYDGQFVLKKECIPRNVSFQTPIIEMQRSQNHYRALLPWSKLDDPMHTRIQTALQTKQNRPAELKQARKIRETFKVEDARSRRFVAWDLETTTEQQGASSSPFKTYAAGLAWYRAPFSGGNEPVGVTVGHDGEEEMLYVSFWGMDAIEQFISFLAEHAPYFANATLWAHNGGKFDVPLLMREHLFAYPGATIDGKRCVILNGRWIGFTVTFAQEESIIYFRDSLAMIPGSLAKLCADYQTPHQKLVETVSHDDINLQNWRDYEPQLSQYLQNDCFGLLELMDRFSAEIFQMSFHQKCEKHFGERNTANVLEKLLTLPHMSFRKQRPEWCKNVTGQKLELDGLCDVCAFEFQDEYHYKPEHMFNRKTGYERRVSDDQCKVDICKQRNLPLIIVPYWVRHPHKIVAFLKKELTRMEIQHDKECTMSYAEITRDRVLQSGGICLNSQKGRSPMTSAGVAKRLFFNKFYGKYPVFTLTKEQDAYIRASYFGGRVELFQLGVVHGSVFYLDFTSLYPAMGAAHLLPYGDPVLYPTFTNNQLPDEFFGFVRCMVTSTPHGRTRTPLHGIKSGNKTGKLLFAHIETAMELTLFSEEIRKGMQEGLYTYQFLDGIGFKRGPLMRDANLSLFEMKKQANADGRSACEKVVKQEVNSMYGFWGLRTERRESIKIYPSDDVRDVYSYLAKDALLEESDHGQYTCLRVVDDLDVIDFNVSVAAGITSWARMRLWGLIDDIERRGGRVFSCDTDSITTDLDLSLHSDLMQKYIPDWDTAAPGTELGSLKCECTAEISKRFKKQGLNGEALKRAMEVERKGPAPSDPKSWRPIPFHHPDGTLCNSANKLYALRTRLQTGEEFEICKAKGISKKFGFEDYVRMFDTDNPHPLTDPQQMQFKLGLSAYCTDGGIAPVTKCLVHKETHALDPTTALALYDKGTVDPETLKVTPLVLHGTGHARPAPAFMHTVTTEYEEPMEWDDLF